MSERGRRLDRNLFVLQGALMLPRSKGPLPGRKLQTKGRSKCLVLAPWSFDVLGAYPRRSASSVLGTLLFFLEAWRSAFFAWSLSSGLFRSLPLTAGLSLGEELHEGLIEGRAVVDLDKIGPDAATGLAVGFDKGVEGLQVAGPDGLGIGQHAVVRLGLFEPHLPVELEAHFAVVEHLEHDQVVTGVSQVVQAVDHGVLIAEEVADDDDE